MGEEGSVGSRTMLNPSVSLTFWITLEKKDCNPSPLSISQVAEESPFSESVPWRGPFGDTKQIPTLFIDTVCLMRVWSLRISSELILGTSQSLGLGKPLPLYRGLGRNSVGQRSDPSVGWETQTLFALQISD